MKINLIGNGPSIKYFDNSIGIRIGCNFAQPDLKPDWTMIADIKPVKKFYEGFQLCCPAMLSERAYDFIAKKTIKLSEDRLTIKRVVPFIHDKEIHHKWGMNSAQHAVYYGIQEHEPTEVHLWGCDSLWSSNIESTTDAIVHKNLEFMNEQEVYYTWRDYWNKIFIDNPTIQFVVHGPEKPDLQEADNYEWQDHSSMRKMG